MRMHFLRGKRVYCGRHTFVFTYFCRRLERHPASERSRVRSERTGEWGASVLGVGVSQWPLEHILTDVLEKRPAREQSRVKRERTAERGAGRKESERREKEWQSPAPSGAYPLLHSHTTSSG